MKIPTGYQDETGFHPGSKRPERKSAGRGLNEVCEMNVDAGLHMVMPQYSQPACLTGNDNSSLIKVEVVAADHQPEGAPARIPDLMSQYVA